MDVYVVRVRVLFLLSIASYQPFIEYALINMSLLYEKLTI